MSPPSSTPVRRIKPSRRAFLTLGLPTLLLIAWVILPLARGSDTLFLRDVFSTHLPMKAAQAEAMRQGRLPLLDPFRAGGQPLTGNPNAVPFYPDNLLYLLGHGIGGTLWALNAHFWLHWLLAIPAMFWLGRALGMGRRAAWATGALWATGGYFLSQLCFYNLIAGVALTPAFLAAWLRLRAGASGRGGGRRLAATGLLWALLLTSGDPLMAAMALAMAVTATLLGLGTGVGTGVGAVAEAGAVAKPDAEAAAPEAPRPARAWLRPALAALLLGTLAAAPQWVEFLRVLPGSFRALYGYSHGSALVASLDPRQLLDLLLPLAFGRPDQLGAHAFWGHRLYSGALPYYWSLSPGLAVFALAAAAGLPRRLARGGHGILGGPVRAWRRLAPGERMTWWAWLLVAAGLFVSLGRFNPLAAWLFALPGLRYPIKFWLPAALGLTLLAGLGFEAAWVRGDAAARRRFGRALGLAALLLATIALLALARPAPLVARLAASMPEGASGAAAELARWARTALGSLGVAAALALTFRLARARSAGRKAADARLASTNTSSSGMNSSGMSMGAAALMLVIHATAQLVLLRPLMPTDAVLFYKLEPALLDQTTAEMRLAHGADGRLFGSSTLYQGRYPEPEARWLARRAFHELYPLGGAMWNRAYALNVSPEGLSSFHTTIAREAVIASPDTERLRLLAAWGVDRLLLDRPLATSGAGAAERLATPVVELPSFGGTVYLYALPAAAPAIRLATRIHPADGPEAAFRLLTDPAFDPRHDLVVEAPEGRRGPGTASSSTGSEPAPDGAGAAKPAASRVTLLQGGPEQLTAQVEAPRAGVLAMRRSFSALYRARVDGAEVEPLLVNMHQLGVAVPPGSHRVELWVDRRPFVAACLLGLLGLLGLGVAAARRPAPTAGQTERGDPAAGG